MITSPSSVSARDVSQNSALPFRQYRALSAGLTQTAPTVSIPSDSAFPQGSKHAIKVPTRLSSSRRPSLDPTQGHASSLRNRHLSSGEWERGPQMSRPGTPGNVHSRPHSRPQSPPTNADTIIEGLRSQEGGYDGIALESLSPTSASIGDSSTLASMLRALEQTDPSRLTAPQQRAQQAARAGGTLRRGFTAQNAQGRGRRRELEAAATRRRATTRTVRPLQGTSVAFGEESGGAAPEAGPEPHALGGGGGGDDGDDTTVTATTAGDGEGVTSSGGSEESAAQELRTVLEAEAAWRQRQQAADGMRAVPRPYQIRQKAPHRGALPPGLRDSRLYDTRAVGRSAARARKTPGHGGGGVAGYAGTGHGGLGFCDNGDGALHRFLSHGRTHAAHHDLDVAWQGQLRNTCANATAMTSARKARHAAGRARGTSLGAPPDPDALAAHTAPRRFDNTFNRFVYPPDTGGGGGGAAAAAAAVAAGSGEGCVLGGVPYPAQPEGPSSKPAVWYEG